MSFYVGAHALILDKHNKVLITKRSANDDYMPSKWDLPGGSVDMGETVEDALVREVKEETNINITVVCPIYLHTDLSYIPDKQFVQVIYKCDYIDGDIILDYDEHEEYQWIEYDEIGKLECIAFLENLIRVYKIYAT